MLAHLSSPTASDRLENEVRGGEFAGEGPGRRNPAMEEVGCVVDSKMVFLTL